MNPDSGFRWRFWPLLSGIAGLVLTLIYGLRHPEILAVRESLVCQWQEAAIDWPGLGMFLTALQVHSKAVASVLALFTLSWLAGVRVLGFLHGDRGGTLLPTGIGLGLVSIMVFALGLAGLLSVAGLLTGGFFLVLAGLAGGRVRIPAIPVLKPRILSGVILLFAIGGLLTCLYPEWYLDGLAWHLAIPERHLMDHKVVPLAHFFFSLFPMVGEMLYAAVLPFGGEEGAKMVNLGCGLAAAGAAGKLAMVLGVRSMSGPLIAILAFLSMPMMHLQNGVAFIDNIRTFLETLALIEVVSIWAEGRGNAAVAGSLMGLAFGVKYLSGYRAMLLALALALTPGMKKNRRLGAVLGFSLAGFLAALPWLVRGWLDGADPVYPMLAGARGAFGFGREEMKVWVQESRHFYAGAATLSSWLALPWNFYLDAAVGRFGSYTVGPLPAAFAVLLLGYRKWTAPALLVLGVCALEWIGWSVTSQVGRYLMPLFAAFFALAGWVSGGSPRAGKAATSIILVWSCFSLVLGSNHRCNLYQSYGLGGYTFGRLAGEDMAAARGFGRSDMKGLPPGKLLLFGDIPPLGTGRRWVGASGFNHPLVTTWARESADGRRLAVKARQAGVRGVVLSEKDAKLQSGRAPGYGTTARESRLVKNWMASLRRRGANRRLEFFEVLSGR